MQVRTRLALVGLVAVLATGCGGSDKPTVAAGTTSSPGAGVVPSGAVCPDVGITPQSSDIVTDIRVTGASCDQATVLAKAAPRDGSPYMAAGFGCEAGAETQPAGGGIAGRPYRCLMGNLLVTFTRH